MKKFCFGIFAIGMMSIALLSCTGNNNANQQPVAVPTAQEQPAQPAATDPAQPATPDAAQAQPAATSAIPEATAAYNLPMNNPATRAAMMTTTQPRSQTYLVDSDGFIMMPQLGRIAVGGKTTDEVREHITSLIAKDVKDPFVRVEIVNFGIDVLGEVRNPHRVVTGQQYYTVLDALAACNDLTEFGRRDRVYVIRTENDQRTYHRLDLTSSEIFNSPYFYLQQNDVVYVEPNQIRIDNSKYNQNNAFKLSVISTVVSSVSVIASLIIALAR